MKNWKLPLIIAVVFIFTFGLTGCQKGGNRIKNEHKTDYSILINFGSKFVYTFKDEETGVWYISTPEGVTPRFNSDGTLYVSDSTCKDFLQVERK
jgi:hypothetical protein